MSAQHVFIDFMWLSRHPRLSTPPYSAPWQSRHSGIHTAYTTSRREHNFCVPYPGQYRGSKKLIIDHRPRVNRPSRSSMNGRIAVQRDQLDQNLAPVTSSSCPRAYWSSAVIFVCSLCQSIRSIALGQPPASRRRHSGSDDALMYA